jgi:hypothetical protein
MLADRCRSSGGGVSIQIVSEGKLVDFIRPEGEYAQRVFR